MTRKRRDVTDADVERWIQQGWGQGEGDDYRPWVKIRDVPSLGRSTRIAGLKSRRVHHLLSDVEYGHFLCSEFRADVDEVREQIALLPRSDTLRIATDLGIRHPTYPGTRTPVVMTSDLWLQCRGESTTSARVLCVKRRSALTPSDPSLRRTIEKLSIERRYWQERGVDWRLVTESEYDDNVVLTLGLLRPEGRVWRTASRWHDARRIAELALLPSNRKRSFRDVLLMSGLALEAAFQSFGLAVWKRWLSIDLSRPPLWGAPIPMMGGSSHA